MDLFRFIGRGGTQTGWNALVYSTSRIGIEGMQHEKALHYAKLVAEYTETQLWKDRKIEYNFKVDHYKCLKCGHESASKIKCIYCGSQEVEKVS